MTAAIKLRREDYPHGDAIWEHKKGRIWQIVGRQERAPSDPHAARLDLERLAELAESGECCVLHNYTLEALVAEIRSLRAEVADLKDEMAGMIPIEQA